MPEELPDFIYPGSEYYEELLQVWNNNFQAESIARWNWIWLPVVDGLRSRPYFMKDKYRKKDLKKGRYGPDPAIVLDS